MPGDTTFRFPLRDTQFVLFEQLRVQRMLEWPSFRDYDADDLNRLLAEGVKFAQNVLAPANEAGDRQGCQFNEGEVRVPAAFHQPYRQQCESGWMTMNTPPEYGGQGLPMVVGAAVGESFVGANCSLSMLPGLTRAATHLLIECGSDAMRERYLEPLISGRWQGTMCLTEPHAGTAVGSVTTAAVKRGDEYFVRGQKIFISGGDHDLVDNVIHFVLARVEGAPPGTKGLSLFLIPKFMVGDDGSLGARNDVQCVGIEKKLGIHGSPTCAMSFGDQDQCKAFLVGNEQQGMELMFKMMNWARIGVGLQGLALGSAAYLFALEYARNRIQGPEMKNFRDPNAPLVPIVKHPDVRRMLSLMKAFSEGGRALLLYTAYLLDHATSSPDEDEKAKAAGRAELLTPLCKAWCSDTGFEVANLALQTLGGHGYLKDYPIEQYLRDVKIAAIYEGANGIQAIDLLGRKVGRQQGQLFMSLMSDIGQFCEQHAAHAAIGESTKLLEARKTKLEQISMNFVMLQMSGDVDLALLSATPYLRMLSNVVISWLLLQQAIIAHDALQKVAPGGSVGDSPEAQFYDNKVKTARFFTSTILAENDAFAAAIDTADRSALEMNF